MSMFSGRFSGRTAVITGGASGLGLLASKRIIEEGGRVSLWDVNVSAPGANQKLPPGVHAVQVPGSTPSRLMSAIMPMSPQLPGKAKTRWARSTS